MPAQESKSEEPSASEPVSEDEKEQEPSMSETDALKKIGNDVKEFFAIRNLDEAEDYFTKLPSAHRHLLVEKLVTFAIESKEADAKLVGDIFAQASEKNLCSASAFEEGFIPVAELLDDIAIDAPKAFDLMAIMLRGAKLGDESKNKIAGKSMDSDKLLALLA
jgi:translation initiation factor 4G